MIHKTVAAKMWLLCVRMEICSATESVEDILMDGKRTGTERNRIERRKYYDKRCHNDQQGLSDWG